MDSKFFGLVSFSSTKNPVFMRGPAVRKTKYFAVLSVSSFQKFFLRKKHQENGGLTYTEAYRSGHNGPDSKSGSLHGLVGSNPTASAIEKSSNHAGFWIFSFYTHSKNRPIFGCSFHSFGKNSFSLYSLHFFAAVSHLLPKSTVSGSAIPLTIACADDNLEL